MNTKQKGNQFENKIVEEVYLPIDETAENVGGGARKRYAGDIKTQIKINNKQLIPECKNNKTGAFITDFTQAIEQANKVDGIPILHKNIHRKHLSVVIMRQTDFAGLLQMVYKKTKTHIIQNQPIQITQSPFKEPIGFEDLTTLEKQIYKKYQEGSSWVNIGKSHNITAMTAKMKYHNAIDKLTRAQMKEL